MTGSPGSVRLPLGSCLAAGAVALLLMLVSTRYGFHRDELYFIESGHHPAWAEPDNPMLVPYLAAGWHAVVGGRLWAFRILPAVFAAGYVLVSGLIAQQFGGRPRHQVAASIATASTGLVLAAGHIFSTLTFDMTVSAAAVWLLIMAVRTGRWLPWLLTGLATGIAMEIRMMAIFIIASCLVAILITGPRRSLAGPKVWVSAAIALALAAPNLIWQANHGWPMRQIATNIAAGGSTSSTTRAALVPEQMLIVGPIISIIVIVGIVWLLRKARRFEIGWIATGYLLFLVIMVITGGKAYYPAPFIPALLAAGAIPLLDIVGRKLWRKIVALVVLIISAIITANLTLPLWPPGSAGFQIGDAVNPDSAETVGWDGYIHTVAEVSRSIPAAQRPATVIITSNYGEAGALARARRLATPDGQKLPPVFSGHNGFGLWGPPPSGTNIVIMVGEQNPADLKRWFADCRTVSRLVSPNGVDNQEAGAPVRICSGPRRSWPRLWPELRHLG